jgi:tRNA pseudouridine38-40 synthase
MPRYHLTIEYDGTDFVGWQRQENGPSVQQSLEEAIAVFAGGPVTVFGAGRTDAGVHALAQAAHVDFDAQMAAGKVRDATNYHLKPLPIAILDAREVGDDFHARFSATSRHYLYRLIDRRAPLTLDRAQIWRSSQSLDAEAMDRAAQALIGKHDFTTFRSSNCQATSPVKTLNKISIVRDILAATDRTSCGPVAPPHGLYLSAVDYD